MDVAALITAVAGAVGAIIGVVQWNRGRRDTIQQQAVANTVQQREQEHDELVKLNELLRQDIDAERRYRREDAERHIEALAAERRGAAGLREQLDHCSAAVSLLRRAVHDEAMRAAADLELNRPDTDD